MDGQFTDSIFKSEQNPLIAETTSEIAEIVIPNEIERVEPSEDITCPVAVGGEIPALAAPKEDPASDGDIARIKKSRSRLTKLVCLILGLVSTLSYVGAGIFLADALTKNTSKLFASELVAADGTASQDDVPTIPAIRPTDPADTDIEIEAPPESDALPVRRVDLSVSDTFALANDTKFDVDIPALTSVAAFAEARGDEAYGDGALVLVIHTHATERYMESECDTYNDKTEFRTTDPTKNMIEIGNEICRALDEAGIMSVHCTEMFDEESFIDSYEKSAAAVRQYLAENPTIRYVLDVHRDAIFTKDSALLAPVTADGAAQVMIVCGTNEMGANFPDWRQNLSFAFSIQSAAAKTHPGLMRNVNLRGASFNEQLSKRFLLVEVGSAGNTLTEAKAGAREFARAFADVIGAD